MSTGDAPGRWDFFISYTQADRAWAEWIAWVLEADGFRVLIQAWDFVPGSNWIQSMQAGARDDSRTIAVLSDGRILASAGAGDRTLRLWGTANGAMLRKVTGDTAVVRWVAFSPDGNLLASVGGDKTLRLWDVASGTLARTLTGHTEVVYGVAFSPDGSLVATASGDKTVGIWLTRPGAPARNLTGHSSPVTCVAFSPDGKLLASAGSDHLVQLWG
jgi:WD40 repeat protein